MVRAARARRLRTMRTFDVVVVGGGPTGEEAAARVSDRGLSVALVEDRLVGGECGHWACIPSKALLRPPEVLAEAGRIRGARESLNGGPNVAAVLARRDEVIGVDARTGEPDDAFLMPWVQSHRIALVRGRGRLTGERHVTVGDMELEIVGLNPGGFLEVDEHLRVRGVPWLYAAGDITGRAQFTHMGKYQARIAVGHTTQSATAAGIDFDVYDTETSANL